MWRFWQAKDPRMHRKQHNTTIGETVRHLVGDDDWPGPLATLSTTDKALLAWPPDMFAVCMALLRRSAGYLRVTNRPLAIPSLAPVSTATSTLSDVIRGKHVAMRWRSALDTLCETANWYYLVHDSDEADAKLLDTQVFKFEDPPLATFFATLTDPTIEHPSPIPILGWWREVKKAAAMPLSHLGDHSWTASKAERAIFPEQIAEQRMNNALLYLAAACDETSERIGIFSASSPSPKNAGVSFGPYLSLASRILGVRETLSRMGHGRFSFPASLCRIVRTRKAIVMPKLHTPQSGMTIRSMSHHLALIRGAEVSSHWCQLSSHPSDGFHDSLTLLLVPYPYRTNPSQFRPIPPTRNAITKQMPHTGSRYFRYIPISGAEGLRVDQVNNLVESASKQIGNIDGVVFPEMSMTPTQYADLRDNLLGVGHWDAQIKFLIAGVVGQLPGLSMDGLTDFDSNYAAFAAKQNGDWINKEEKKLFADLGVETGVDAKTKVFQTKQNKHHRWKLDAAQIRQYGLGAGFHLQSSWSEYTYIPRRKLNFFVFNGRLVASVLICEDLAQADPIGDVLRAVAPGLVICLLADGPQPHKMASAIRHSTDR